MSKKLIILFVFCALFYFVPNTVLAHPGRTDSNGCHYCRTNCSKWGLNDNEYHCHNGSSSSSSNSSNTQSVSSVQVSKSSDNTLKSVTVDGRVIDVSDKMTSNTKKETVSVSVEANDSKATYNIDDTSLIIGLNTINIKEVAENGAEKTYVLLVNREKLSNNTDMKLTVDGDEITFTLGKADIDVSSDTKNLNYKYKLADENAKIKVKGDKNLKAGENLVVFTVTAEDGTKKKYELTVDKSVGVNAIFGLAMLGGIGYGIYYFVKKRNK